MELCANKDCNKDLATLETIVACEELFCSMTCAIKVKGFKKAAFHSETIAPTDCGVHAE